MTHAYFPASAVVSLMYLSDSGATMESAVVGNDGLVGISLLLGGGPTCNRAVVQTAGDAYRIPASALKEEFNRGGPAMQILLRYLQARLAQTTQSAICNRQHTVAQQFACSLLQSLDRQPGQDLLLTQEGIAERLGVRREGITLCANRAQKQGLIRYARGHISVRDRKGLERQACECYGVVKRECRRLLPEPLVLAESAETRCEPIAA
jgi:CRP-like cAMP-binding protein